METMKIRVKSPEHSAAIQEKLFEMGQFWAGVYAETYVRFTNATYLFVSGKGIQKASGRIDGKDDYFEKYPSPEYLFEDGDFKPAAPTEPAQPESKS